MKGPIPKPAATRQRRNRVSTASTLDSIEASRNRPVPPLPKLGKWHPRVLEWWESVWTSPMAGEYLEADKQRLYRIAVLQHDFWTCGDRAERLRIAAEIAKQELPLGLTPIDRRRLQWEVEKAEEAVEKTERRRQRRAPADPSKDPRNVLKIVKEA